VDEIEKKPLRSMKIKASKNKKNKNQTQNKYKIEDTTKF
jgi:hypothetical protein